MVTLFLKHHCQESDVFSPEVTHCLNGPVEGVEDVAPEIRQAGQAGDCRGT